ncbi:MAG: peptide deformylase [Actinomycetota bacterium]
MTVRPVLRLPHPVLKEVAKGAGGSELIQNLVDTMYSSPACVGLAANQIGVAARAFVVDVTNHPKTTTCHGLVALEEPAVLSIEGSVVGREGCMSVPDLTANVIRADSIVVAGTSPEGEQIEIATEGFEARALQHELDHLDGVLILDRVASLSTDVFRRKVYR